MENTVLWESQTPVPNLARRLKDPDWERKQRAREYRVAARREKRNRKGDEKKQRKLNATILRRMTRNPDKYTKNAERNRMRAIESERRIIRSEALKQVERLAAVYDPSGSNFNIGPVIVQADGSVISLEALKRREERQAAKLAVKDISSRIFNDGMGAMEFLSPHDGNHPPKIVHIASAETFKYMPRQELSNSQTKKLATLTPQTAPSKPRIPEGIRPPKGEENWLELWDLPDEQLEQRVIAVKRKKVSERKSLRQHQKSGKVERRAARDEKRAVYKNLKRTWRAIKGIQDQHKTRMKAVEQEESKRIAVSVNEFQRHLALHICEQHGFTIDNTEEAKLIEPQLKGKLRTMKIDWNQLDIGEGKNIKPKHEPASAGQLRNGRIDLSRISTSADEYITPAQTAGNYESQDYVKLDAGGGQGFEAIAFNNKIRGKIRRALDRIQLQKEQLVRSRLVEHCQSRGVEVPEELLTPLKIENRRGYCLRDNGSLESEKAERLRRRLELTEFNEVLKVLRKQAKNISHEAGLRVHAEMTGRIPPYEPLTNREKILRYGSGWLLPEETSQKDILKPQDVAVI